MKRVGGSTASRIALSAVMVLGTISIAFEPRQASAAQIIDRSLTLQAGATDGGSKPGGVVRHQFDFTVPTTASAIGSIKFEYCTVASGTCVTPEGLSTTSATIENQGANATGFTIVNTTNGAPYLTKATAAAPTAGELSYRLGTVTNPNVVTPSPQPNYTFFVRISTYASTDTSGVPIDTGTVAAATATQIELTGTMPESLIFCTGETIGTNVSGQPDCTTATAGEIEFDQLFSPTDTATALSQMAASTNATNGYSITVTGNTLTSGSNTIPAMTTATTGARGTGQFGFNLRANTTATSTVARGTDITPTSDAGLDLRGNPQAGYEQVDFFKFNPAGESIAQSNFGGTLGPTNSQIYTATYIVNVSGAQTAGTYTTTLTYVCTPTF